jgi:hypothetical protein
MVKKGARGGGPLVDALTKDDPLLQKLESILAQDIVNKEDIQNLLDTNKEDIDKCLKTITQTFPQLDDIVKKLLTHADDNGVIPKYKIDQVLGNVNEQAEKQPEPEPKPQEENQQKQDPSEEQKGGKSGRKGKPAKKAPKAGRKVKGGANVNLSTDFSYIANTSGLQITPDPVAQASSSTMTSIANYASPFSSGATTTNPLMDLPPAYSTTLNPSLVGGGKKPRKPAAPKPKRKTKGGEK